MMRAAFRVDSGPHVGMGHLSRCLSLAQAIACQGGEAIFVKETEPSGDERIIQHGFALRNLSPDLGLEDDLEHTLKMLDVEHTQVVVVDSYAIDEKYLASLRQSGRFVVCIDDLAKLNYSAHIVVNGGVSAHSLRYSSSTGDTRFLLGPQYALLRKEFWELPTRISWSKVRNVLVTLGSSDPGNLMPRILDALDTVQGAFETVAVIGPYFENVELISLVAARSRHTVRQVNSPDLSGSLRDLMVEADLAISAGGQTLNELAAVGCPTVALCVADNQIENIRGFSDAGVVEPCQVEGYIDVMAALPQAVERLIGDDGLRRGMGQRGQQFIDGKGANRVAGEIVALFAGVA